MSMIQTGEWRAVCATDVRCIASSKAIQDAREVLRSKEDVLSKLQIKSKPAF
ncbi:hypothetical protein HBE96_23325 [Clostridium sp. P21]|uniref:Uncharacterized protein n=1 Tax=Clostridium muellerianum TaxID=2716538 RepID=A0A7Y0ELB0_9CLOT|nr:hypothetical protein [Clostridium muellerianum]NMM65512.1 hypothetical protein [Clostridium muellerianum]